MKPICPFCGSSESIPFSDSVFKTHGFECEKCHKDFCVDDGKVLSEHENNLIQFRFRHIYKDGSIIRVTIEKNGDSIFLTPSKITSDRMLQPYSKIDFTNEYPGFVKLIYEGLSILDWPLQSTGLMTGKNDESFEIVLKYNNGIYPESKISGTNNTPVLFPILEQLFSSLFEEN